MDNNLLLKHKNDPAWAEVIRLYSGLFDTQDERETFILDLAQTDILLAAECKTSSIEEEDSVLEFIILECCKKYNTQKDVLSLFTLLKLEEYWIVDYLLGITKKALEPHFTFIKKNAPITDFINHRKDKIPTDVMKNLLILMASGGYKFNLSYFKINLQLLNNSSEIRGFYEEMISKNIQPDIKLMNSLIAKSNSTEDILFFIEQINYHQLHPKLRTYVCCSKKVKNFDTLKPIFDSIINKQTLSNGELSKLFCYAISISTKISVSDSLLETYNKIIQQGAKRHNIKVKMAYFESKILLSVDYDEANKYFTEAETELNGVLTLNLLYCFMSKIENEMELYLYWEKYEHILLPDDISITSREFEKTVQVYNSILFYLVEKTICKTNEFSQILDKICVLTIPIEPSIIKKIFIKFSFSKFSFLLKYLLKTREIDQNYYTDLINSLDKSENYSALFDEMNKAEFPFNQILYNVFIKKSSDVDFCIKLLKEMKSKFKADKFTYSSILNKNLSVEEIFSVIEMCSKDGIEVDGRFRKLLSSLMQTQKFSTINISKFRKSLSINWFNLIAELQKTIKIISCYVTKLTYNRIFVKIDNETRSASIYIGELSNKRIDDIFDFEYNGEKLHIGQRLTAKIISIDEQNRINLSLKQL